MEPAFLRRARELIWPVESASDQMDGWVVCGSSSMEPTVMVGQRVRIRPCERIRPGDVIVFEGRARDVKVLHRVVFKVPMMPWFIHQGDSPTAAPGLASAARVLGRASELPRRSPSKSQLVVALTRLTSAARRVTIRAVRGR